MAAERAALQLMTCGFCGLVFDASAAEVACVGCPLAGGCHLVRCPRCGYEMPPESPVVNWVRRQVNRVRRQKRVEEI